MSEPLLVKDIHRIREENARQNGFDAQAMARGFIRRQKKSRRVVVNRQKLHPKDVGPHPISKAS